MSDKHVDAFTKEHLMPGETITDWVEALRHGDTLQGRLIATSARLIYFRKGMLSEKLEAWNLQKITSVESQSGFIVTKLKFYTSGDKIELGIYGEKRMAKQFVSNLQRAVNSADAAVPSANSSSQVTEDFASTLSKLAQLKEKGLITDEEYAAKKAEVLAKI